MRLNIILLFATLLVLTAGCRPELEDEDGSLAIDTFADTALTSTNPDNNDTIVEDNYTEPSCMGSIDSNIMEFQISVKEIDNIEINEQNNANVVIIVDAGKNTTPELHFEIHLPPDTLPRVRKNYELVPDFNFGQDESYIFVQVSSTADFEYRAKSGTLHFYRKENGGFKLQLCDVMYEQISDNSIGASGEGWIEQ